MFQRNIRLVACLMIASVALGAFPSWAGDNNNLFNRNQTGGVSIDPDGVVGQPDAKRRELFRQQLLKNLEQIPDALDGQLALRKVSLKGLEAAVSHAMTTGVGVIPDEVQYLAGLQRVQYVLVFPELNDIVLAGPAEGWSVDPVGNVVGRTTGEPVLLLDDLLVALRTVDAARQVGISCSIDPTPEGRQALTNYLNGVKQFNPSVPKAIEKALGPQTISVTGVPTNSHFSRVMVAADYRMKRIAMQLEPSPVPGLPSFIDLVKQSSRANNNMMPRWWLACNYEPLARSDDGLAWEIRGQGVKALTEDDIVADDGSVRGSGQTSPLAERWAKLMTERYNELAKQDVTFLQLRNLMDLCVAAALIEKEDLLAQAGCSVPHLTAVDSKLTLDRWNPPKTVDSQCSFVKKGRQWIITASGGVQIESWQVADRTTTDPQVKQAHSAAKPPADAKWYWN